MARRARRISSRFGGSARFEGQEDRARQQMRSRRDLAVAYLNALLEDADQEELLAALERIAVASGGPKLAEKVELNAVALYRTLCRRDNPDLKSAVRLLKAMGMRLMLQPIATAAE